MTTDNKKEGQYGKILVVEDNLAARKTVQRVLKRRGIEADYVVDLKTAQAFLAEREYDAVITDLFFPQETGTGKRESGRAVLEEMLQGDAEEHELQRRVKRVREFITPEDSSLEVIRSYCNSPQFTGNEETIDLLLNSKYTTDSEVVKKNSVREEILKEIFRHISSPDWHRDKRISSIAKRLEYYDSLEDYNDSHPTEIIDDAQFQPLREYAAESGIDYYAAMHQALEEKEENQPNGLVLAKNLQERKIPFVVATSAYHHDVLGQKPADFFDRRYRMRMTRMTSGNLNCYGGWQDSDLPEGKTTEDFWESALRELDLVVNNVGKSG